MRKYFNDFCENDKKNGFIIIIFFYSKETMGKNIQVFLCGDTMVDHL